MILDEDTLGGCVVTAVDDEKCNAPGASIWPRLQLELHQSSDFERWLRNALCLSPSVAKGLSFVERILNTRFGS